jgi:DNA-binding NtrC family response regulator
MTVAQIIDEIKNMPPDEQAGVVRFVYQLDAERKLSGEELSALAARFVSATDPAEASRVREEIVRGFYGTQPHA